MIAIKTNTSATEDIITVKFVPIAKQLWDEAQEKGAPLYSPKEIAEVFPDLNKDSQRQALRRMVAKEPQSEVTEHIRALVAYVDYLRAATYFEAECWSRLREIYRGVSSKVLRRYFLQILTMWCYPFSKSVVSAIFQEKLEGFERDDNKYMKMVYTDYSSLTYDDLEELGKNFIKTRNTLKQQLGDSHDRKIQNEIDNIGYALDEIEIIQNVMEGHLVAAWEIMAQAYGYTDADVCPEMVELIRFFYKK